MLKLPVPETEYENVVLKLSEFQKEMVASLAERAETVRDRQVQPYEDNMLKITNDGRKLALSMFMRISKTSSWKKEYRSRKLHLSMMPKSRIKLKDEQGGNIGI